ncbi:MAG: hypothetical protein K2Y15_09870 [Burkholderiaceae bacterium]|nr:hypothetical protein [Burkholderiaceae bacterium]
MTNIDTPSDLIRALENLSVFERSGHRAVHKPLLVLLALTRVQTGADRLVRFSEIENELGKLIHEFGTTSTKSPVKPQYPFWYLKSEGFWEIHASAELSRRKGKNEPTAAALRETGAAAGFKDMVWELLRQDPNLIAQCANVVLAKSFPESMREDVLDAVGLDVPLLVHRVGRTPKFRTEVLRAYNHCCAICGYDGRLEDRVVGVEAAC